MMVGVALVVLTISLNSCGKIELKLPPTVETEEKEEPVIPEDEGDEEDDELVTNSQDIQVENGVVIVFDASGVTVDNALEGKGVVVDNDGGHVTVTNSSDQVMNLVLSGLCSNGSVKCYGEAPFALLFNGVGLTNPAGAAINIQNKKGATVTLVEKTNNRLIDGKSYTAVEGEDMKATLFSEGDLTFSGSGTLEVRGLYKHGICSDGALLLNGGTIRIKEAVSDGLHANDEIVIAGSDLEIRCESDGIESESKEKPIEIRSGNLKIITTGEKGHAVKSKQNITIDSNDKIEITLYGAASKGLKPTGDLLISKGDITLNVAGDAIWETEEADISSAAGIKCDGNFRMDGGDLTIVATGAGGKGINVDGTIDIYDGTIAVSTTGNPYVYDRNNDTAAKAIKSDGELTIHGGMITILTTKSEAEGLESKSTLTINDGDVVIEAYDDCINATNHIQINGGRVFCNSQTNDAIDSNGTLSIAGGLVIACGADSPEGGIDCDNNRFTITGGTLIGLGGDTSSPTGSVCKQRSLIYRATTSNVKDFYIKSAAGDVALMFALPRSYNREVTLLFNSPLLKANTGYTIHSGGTISNGTSFYGYYSAGTYSGGSQLTSFTAGSAEGAVTTVGTSNGPGGNPGGFGPGGW